MTDENEDENQGIPQGMPMFAMQIGPTPEQIAHERMHWLANAHEMKHFFESLDETQLRKLAAIMRHCYVSDGDNALYYSGIIQAILDRDHKVCLGCGEKHEDISELIPEPEAEPTGKAREELLYLYNIMETETGLVCIGCGTRVSSLKDRMLRKPGPEGCEGCVHKVKWG